ncbi:glycoside hydrolase family 3 N-terminal domain-containing protein [Ferruginibacter albus]|uniref:glycoside hydrolase family 3 N-terminal domain-containing protein n=1 Tax=Ferruginibacter albus TaxID=2875540 RepID=UPI001CC5C066|nr:glycoside hydrolase family 3 N-terminal domain-containing protein [Ferruginibacter albus]UAY50851.1 glycoside hydrolase family 3 C-terminal domain-containing protein [Ferruginibacter albus]
MKFSLQAFYLFLVIGFVVDKGYCQKFPYQNNSLSVEERVKDLVSRMTNEEKIKQLDMYWGKEVTPMTNHEATVYDEKFIARALGNFSIGSVHDFYPAYAAVSNKVQQYIITHSRLGIPVMFIEEGLHGYLGKGSTSFPIPLALSATWDTALIYKVARSIATETRANGTNMILGPLLDIARDPRWGRMEETYGEDTYLVSEIGLAMVKGLQGNGINNNDAVISEPKHFIVHGIPEGGSNTSPVNVGVREMRSVYFPTFEKAVRQGKAWGIMAAYHEIDGLPMVDNKWLLTDVLRKEWGFKGFVLSDLGAIKLTLENHFVASSRTDALAQTLNAGLNMQFYDFVHNDFDRAMDSALQNKMITQQRLDSAVGDVLRVKFELGLFDNPYIDTTLWSKEKHSEFHQQLALQAAQQSICLLKNKGEVLPLKKVSRVALIGKMAVSNYLGGYSNTQDTAISLLTALQQRAKNITIDYTAGISKINNDSALQKAIELVKRSDVAVVALGEELEEIGEGKDRADLDLSDAQMKLIKAVQQTGKPVVVVLMNGRALCINWVAENIPAIVESWFGGEKSGLAIADVLLGNVNPSGKLPVTFPRSVGQIPIYYNHKPTSYHKYVDEKDTPLYAFGYGLSYTTFVYSDLKLPSISLNSDSIIEIKLNLTNSGKVAGTEVVQLYVRDMISSVTTPEKSLRSFSRVYLQPNETKEVVFKLNKKEALSLWNRDMQNVVEPGEFKIMIGSSSDDIRLTGSVEVK